MEKENNNSKEKTRLRKLEERRKKTERKRAKYSENNLHHFEKEIESHGGLEQLLKNKFLHTPIELDLTINDKYISINYKNTNYNITYNPYKKDNITSGIYFQYQNKKSTLTHSSIPHDFEIFFYKIIEN